jgi:ADP-ribosylglycohydrolase
MRYSLLSRFKGTLFGAAIAVRDPKSTQDLEWAILGIESLISCGKLDLEHWTDSIGVANQSRDSGFSSSTAMIASLPIMLFFHEDELALGKKLHQAAQVWQQTPETTMGMLAVGYAIAQALKEKLPPPTLIPQVCNYLATTAKNSEDFRQQLAQVQRLLVEPIGLERTINQLCPKTNSSTANIALAFYFFLSLPEDFRLCLGRIKQQIGIDSSVGVVVGALSGAYNGSAGIPVVQQQIIGSQRQKLKVLAENLLAVWSGANLTNRPNWGQSLAIAAPRVIQPRN